MKRARAALLILSILAVILASAPDARAEVIVPAEIQAQLISKITAYDRGFRARVDGSAQVLLVRKVGDGDSAALATAMARALQGLNEVGGVSSSVETIDYKGAANLARAVVEKHAAIAYLSLGLESECSAIAHALEGKDVMTVGATATMVEEGANVGFDLVASKTKLVINVSTARAQGVRFTADFLKLTRIVGPAPIVGGGHSGQAPRAPGSLPWLRQLFALLGDAT